MSEPLQRTPRGTPDAPAPSRPVQGPDVAPATQRVRNQVRGMGFEAGRQALRPGSRPEPAAPQAAPEPAIASEPAMAPAAPAAAPDAAKARARKQGKLSGLSIQEVWAAHPHNYQGDRSQDTSSADVLQDQGWDPDQYGNTCAIRMSVMLNTLGGAYAITPAKAVAAGIPRSRVVWSRKKQWYYLLAAKEMWTYAKHVFGKPHATWPARGTFKDAATFQAAWNKDIKAVVTGRKGLVAFEKIFGYGGTGHVDVFDGAKLSDAPSWYPCERLEVWYL